MPLIRRIQYSQRGHGDLRGAVLRRVAWKRSSEAVAGFEGVERRQEVRGEERGIKVIDDFGHHPTAIRETLCAACGINIRRDGFGRCSSRVRTRPAAPFSSRNCRTPSSWPMACSLRKVAKLEQIPEKERLDPAGGGGIIAAAGRPAFYEPDAAANHREAGAAG